jgi:hypothetical protein
MYCRFAYLRRSVSVSISRRAVVAGILVGEARAWLVLYHHSAVLAAESDPHIAAMGGIMAFDMAVLFQMRDIARAPSSPAEMRLVEELAVIGLIMAVCLLRPLVRNYRWLEARKQPRGGLGRELVARMEAPSRFVAGGRRSASLRGRDLRGEDLKDAFLDDLDLSDTDLRGVDLSGASLDGTHLSGARYDAATRWPAGFDPGKCGAVFGK